MFNVLVIDDESMVLDVLRQFLTLLGYSVEIASDGHEGLRMFDSRVYDLVITGSAINSVSHFPPFS